MRVEGLKKSRPNLCKKEEMREKYGNMYSESTVGKCKKGKLSSVN